MGFAFCEKGKGEVTFIKLKGVGTWIIANEEYYLCFKRQKPWGLMWKKGNSGC